MAARVTSRRLGEFLALWLCAWLTAHECLLVLFDFSPLKLVFVSGAVVLLLRLWLYNRKSRLVGAGFITGAVLIVGCLPAKGGAGVQFSAAAEYCSAFIRWIQTAYSSPDLVLHERFGITLWMLFVIGTAVAAVLFLDTFRMPITGALLFCVLFAVLQVAPYVINRDNTRLLTTLVVVIACCIWFYIGKKYDSSRKTRSYARWQRGMALLLLPAILLTTAVAGRSDMAWRSGFFSGGLDQFAESMANVFSRHGGAGGAFLNLSVVQLGGDRTETGAPCLKLKLKSTSSFNNNMYLRTSVFDRYTGAQWQRTLDHNGSADYPSGSQDFMNVLSMPQDRYAKNAVIYELSEFTYHSQRVPTPLGTIMVASARSDDVEKLWKESGKAKDFLLFFKLGAQGKVELWARWNKQVNGKKAMNEEALRTAELTANTYGEVNSDVTVRSQTVAGYLYETNGSYYDVRKQNNWPVGIDKGLKAMTFNELRNKTVIENAYVGPYLGLPSGLPPEVRALANHLKGNGPYETANNIRDYLRKSYTYTLRPDHSNRDFVASFLFDIKEGYCTYFASAMAVLSRACGIPARYVEGYAVDHERAKEGVTLTDSERHAWAELFFPGFGWLTYDATAYSVASSAPIPREDLDMNDYLQEEEEEIPEPEKPKPEPEVKEEEKPKTPEQQTQTADTGKKTVISPKLIILMAAVLAAGLLYLLYRLRYAAWMRTQERYREEPKLILAAYSELLRGAKKLGCGRRPTQTVQDFFAALSALGLSESSRSIFAKAACAVDAAVYGGKEPSKAEMLALADVLSSVYRRMLILRSKVWFTLWWRRGKKDII